MLAASRNTTTTRLALLVFSRGNKSTSSSSNNNNIARHYLTVARQLASVSVSSLHNHHHQHHRYHYPPYPRDCSAAWLSTTGGGKDGNDDKDDRMDLDSLADMLNEPLPEGQTDTTPFALDDDDDDDIVTGDAVDLIKASRSSKKIADITDMEDKPFRRPSKKSSFAAFKKADDDRVDRKGKKPRRFDDDDDDDDDDNNNNNNPLLELLDLPDDDPDLTTMSGLDGDEDDPELRQAKEAAEAQKRVEQKEAMDHKTGRGWTDPWDLDELYASSESYDDLPDWAPSFVSKLSQERVQILSPGIPTLTELARLALPPPPHPHPGHGHFKAYALFRSRQHAAYIYDKVAALAAPRIAAIQALPTWQDKQDAVDELFERIEFTLKEQEIILGKHPKFGEWVEKALEKYLQSTSKSSSSQTAAESTVSNAEDGTEVDADTDTSSAEQNDNEVAFPSLEQDEAALPMFMDCFDADVDSEEENIPKILHPLAPLYRAPNQGRMMEEWQLAAHKTTKRILLRQSTRNIAQFMETHEACRILVTGRQGTGKTSALLSIVAAGRQSGHIVLFMPNVSILAEHFYYVEPNEHRKGVYDLPVLSEQICGQLLTSHKDDLAEIPVDSSKLDIFFSPNQMRKLPENSSMTVADLLSIGTEKSALAAMCYSAAVDTLMNQDIKPFIMVLDEFNTLFQDGHCFHEHYDDKVHKAIPYNQINLFQPAMDAMGLVASENDILPEPVLMKRGAVIGAMSMCKPVKDTYNSGLLTSAQELTALPNSSFLKADVPRLSNLEVDHVMANYETIGFGKLRLDQGETVSNPQEVAYLRILSSNVAQELMNACVL